MKPDTLIAQQATVGFVMTSPNGKRMAFLPAVPRIDDRLLDLLSTVDVLLFDGTFWSEDELIRVQGAGATAREMGHVTVSGEEGSVRKLAKLRRPRKIFVHVNNTNPMLDESSDEYRQVRDAGWEIAEDGWRLDL
jgi:pyrroloquinoline quinone biosynthesis protein B